MNHKLSLSVEPEWQEIETIRQRTAEFLLQNGLDRDTTDCLAMVASELAENATKYGTYAASSRLAVDVIVSARDVVVEVRNPVASSGEAHLARLDRAIQRIRGYQDPFEVYVERLREVSGESLGTSESGLGLVRIAYEGQSVLDFYVNEDDVLAVSAMYSRPSEVKDA